MPTKFFFVSETKDCLYSFHIILQANCREITNKFSCCSLSLYLNGFALPSRSRSNSSCIAWLTRVHKTWPVSAISYLATPQFHPPWTAATSQDLRQHCFSRLELKEKKKPETKSRKKFQEKSTITRNSTCSGWKGRGNGDTPVTAKPSCASLSLSVHS